MNLKKIKKILTVMLLSVTIFAIGCADQPTSSSTVVATTSTTRPPASSTSTAATSTTTTKTTTTTTTTTSTTPKTTASTSTRPTYTAAPAMEIDTSKKYFALLDTSLGTFKIELFASESPITVNNFVFLSRQGFYNGIIFHRIIKTFMIQTGDPKGNGTGGPGYTFKDELPPKHSYDVGIVAMANAGSNTNGSQFFICTGAQAKNLDSHPNYTQFGQVVEGMEVVQKIAAVPVQISAAGETSQPKDPPVINKITILEQ
jgi:cyclophilin family peptidyl-prolyl cis-trans isomerase